jgi:hypothetical protein
MLGRAFTTMLVLLVAVIAACGGDDSSGGSDVASSSVASSSPGVTVSAPCARAMKKYRNLIRRSNADPSFNPNEGPFQVATLKACKSREEWLAGVEPYSSGAACIACAEPQKVLAAMCGGGGRKNLPACREAN